MAPETSLEVLDERSGWYHVRTGGNTGWIWHEYLRGVSGPSGGPTSSDSSGSSDSGSSGSDSSRSSSGSSGSSDSSRGSGSSGGSGNQEPGRSSSSSSQHSQSRHGPYSKVWDELAQCESSGNWSINTGNGYYGGLQFSLQSWQWVGGSGYPHEASKQEQITRAYQLWQRQGWNAWPSCSQQLGLSGNPGGWGDDYYAVHPQGADTVSHSQAAPAPAVQAAYSVPLREEPSATAERVVQIPRGTVLIQLQRESGWAEVAWFRSGEQVTGWVSTTYLTASLTA